jgi:hypothetical protein
LNELERRFLEPVVSASARTIRETADATSNGELGVEMMTGPRLRSIVDTDSILAVMEYEIRISGSAPGSLLLFASCGSSSLIGRIGRPKTSTTPQVPSWTVPAQRRKLLGQIAVDVAVTLEGNRIRFSDLISLQLGDVIALESPLTEQLVGTANGAAVFSGTVSSHKGQRFYKIDSLLSVPRAISISSARATAGGIG